MMALITNQKSPSVRIVKGKVRILSTKPSVALRKPKTSAPIKAAPSPVTKNPGTT